MWAGRRHRRCWTTWWSSCVHFFRCAASCFGFDMRQQVRLSVNSLASGPLFSFVYLLFYYLWIQVMYDHTERWMNWIHLVLCFFPLPLRALTNDVAHNCCTAGVCALVCAWGWKMWKSEYMNNFLHVCTLDNSTRASLYVKIFIKTNRLESKIQQQKNTDAWSFNPGHPSLWN